MTRPPAAPTPERLSVVHVAAYFPPDRIGGVGEVVAHVHQGLLARGHASRVLTSGTSSGSTDVTRVASTPERFVLACWRHAERVRHADVVHVHHGEALGLLLAMRLRRIRTPVLLTLHVSATRIRSAMQPFRVDGQTLGAAADRTPRRSLELASRQALDRLTLRLAREVCFISRSSARDVLPPEEAERAVVVYNGLPPAADDRAERVEPTELLYVGTFSTRKRVMVLPFVLRHVRERRPGARLRLVGFDPGEHPELLALADRLGVSEGLVFEGRKRSSDLPRYYRSSDVLLVPSAYEGLPMVMLEAFQQRLPCVATAVSGHPEVIEDGVSGFLVPLDDPRVMAARALVLLEDPGRRRRMGEEASRVVSERFSVSRQVEEYEGLYRKIATGGPGRARRPWHGVERRRW